jgi:outer membrane protein OmpA-like peptidoglycan-associated protein
MMKQPLRNDPGETERLKELLLGDERTLLRTLEQRIEELFERVGDDAVMAESVRRVIVDVLRESGIKDHDKVAAALAPLVVHTVAQEVPRHSRSMAQSLRPHAKRLVTAGVAGLVRRTAVSVEGLVSPVVWARRVGALAGGRSLISARLGGRTWLEGAVLYDRESNSVIASDFNTYRTNRIVQRGQSLLADPVPADNAKPAAQAAFGRAGRDRFWACGNGHLGWFVVAHSSRPQFVGARLHQVFGKLWERWGETVLEGPRPLGPSITANLVGFLEQQSRTSLGASPGAAPPWPRPLFGYIVMTAALLAGMAFGGYTLWLNWQDDQVLAQAKAALATKPGLGDLPLALQYDRDKQRLSVRGVVGERGVQAQIADLLADALPSVAVDVLLIAPPPAPAAVIAPAPDSTSEDQIKALFARLNLMQSEMTKTGIPIWFSQQVIRFGRGPIYHDPALAEQQIKGIAQVLRDWPDFYHLRVIGYADATGSTASQDQAALRRGLKVVDDLIRAGVPSEQLSAIGRGATQPVSFVHGAGSINRRVEFQAYTPPPSAE